MSFTFRTGALVVFLLLLSLLGGEGDLLMALLAAVVEETIAVALRVE